MSHQSSDRTGHETGSSSGVSRRRYLAGLGAAGVAATSGCLNAVGLGGGGGGTINVLTWEEYADPDIKERIEEEVGVTLEITKSTSSSQMFSSWNAGQYQQYDVAIPNNNYVPKMMAAEKNGEPMIAPVQEDVVDNSDAIYDTFQGFADSQFTADGKRYGVPVRFGWYGYSYDSRAIPEDHEQSYSMLFDDEYSGGIIMYDNHFKAMSAAALYLGYGDAFEGSKVSLSEDQLTEVKNTMMEQKDMLQGYIAADPTYIKSFTQGNFVIGQSGRNEIVEMWSSDTTWPKMATPKEGSLAWFESAVVSQASENKEKAWEVVNEYIAPKNGATLAQVGFSPSVNPDTQQHLSEQENEMFGSIDPSRLDSMIPFKAVENEDAWITAWEEIKSA
jgi:spermidine/putrescine transport system substrate-binding protein